MEIQDLIHHYRLVDAEFGSLETSARIHHDLLALRRDELQNRKKTVFDRFIVVLILLSGGLPVVFGLLPEALGEARWAWVSVIAVISICYWLTGWYQWNKSKDEDDAVRGELENAGHSTPHNDPAFLLMQASSLMTRRNIVKEILATDPPPEVRSTYDKVLADWEERIEELREHVEWLWADKRIDQATYDTFRDWMGANDGEEEGGADPETTTTATTTTQASDRKTNEDSADQTGQGSPRGPSATP